MLARFYSASGDAQATTRCVVPARVLPGEVCHPQFSAPVKGPPSVWQNPVADHLFAIVQDRELGNRIVIDVDDPYFEGGEDWKDSDVEGHLEALKHADTVICTTEPLADAYEQLHPDVRVIPSSVAGEDFQLGRQMQHLDGKLRIGYAAGFTHARDTELIAKALALISTRAGVVVEFIGAFDPGWDFAYKRYPALPYPAYKAMLATWHIGLAPLQPTQLNETRSDLKALDYAMSGAACVATPFGPYEQLAERGLIATAESDDEWFEALLTLVENDELRQKIALTAHHYCRVERHPANQRTAYLDALGLRRDYTNV